MLFAWVALYGLVHTIADHAAGSGLPASWLPGIALGGYDLLLSIWIFRTGRRSAAGLNPVRFSDWRELLSLLPLVVFPVYNLLTMGDFAPEASFLLYMLCIAYTEEVFFRGFLLSYLRRMGTIPGILLTSLAFSLLHAVNFFPGGHGAYVWLQILSSFFVSFCCCAVTIRFGSLLPCAAAHFFTNITGAGSVSGGYALWGLWGCIMIYALWSLKLCLDIRRIKRR